MEEERRKRGWFVAEGRAGLSTENARSKCLYYNLDIQERDPCPVSTGKTLSS
jgi:hypothetical protein